MMVSFKITRGRIIIQYQNNFTTEHQLSIEKFCNAEIVFIYSIILICIDSLTN